MWKSPMFFGKRREEKELVTLTRTDWENPFAAYSKHRFELDGYEWPSVEHYYQATKYGDQAYADQIRLAETPAEATKLGKSKKFEPRRDWNKVKVTVMTRGTYIKCRTYPEIAQQLLDTDNLTIVELSQYDYFWGSGRDMRGNNAFGKMLMAVRNRLREEAQLAN